MPTVTIVVGLVSTLLVGSAILGSLQAIKTTSLDPNVDRAQNEIDQTGDKTITIVGSDAEEAQKKMRGAIVWNMMTASDCRISSATHMMSSTVVSEDGEEVQGDIQIQLPDNTNIATEDYKAFKLAENDDFQDYIAGSEGNGYIGRFNDFQPLINTGFNPTCTGTGSAVKQLEDQVQDAQNDLAGRAVDGLVGIGAGAVAIAACGTGVGCIAVAAVAGGASYMATDASGAGDAMGGYIVPGSQEDIGSEPGFDMEGVFGRMEFNVEQTFLMGTNDLTTPMLATGFRFDTPDNTPGFWRGKRYSYLIPAGLSPDSFEREYHSIFTSGEEVDGSLCLDDDYQRNDCPQFYSAGTTSGNGNGGLYVLDRVYNREGFTLSDPTALQVVNQRMEWILNNKELMDSSPNRRFQQKLEGVQNKGELISEAYANSGGGTNGLSLHILLADLVARGGSIGEERQELVLEDGQSLPDDFPDEDVSGKYSLVDRGSGGGSLARSHFEDTASGTQQERKKMMFYAFRPRMENVPIIAGENITQDDLTAGCSGSCTDMDRLKNFMRYTSYLFCESASGNIQSNAAHIFSSDEASSQDGTLEDQVYPKVEIENNARSCIPEMSLSVPSEVNLDCDPESLINGDSVEIFSRQTADRGPQTVNVVCGTKERQTADLGGYGNVGYHVTEETISEEGCFADWYDVTTDAQIGGSTLQEEGYPKVLAKDESTSWLHNYDTSYDDGDGENEIGGSGENNRLTYNTVRAEYNASRVANLTYRISLTGATSGRTDVIGDNYVNRTIFIEEIPQNSKVIVREVAKDMESNFRGIYQIKIADGNFSGNVRDLVVDRTSEGGISINGERIADFRGYPEQIAVSEIEISPIRNSKKYNDEYAWNDFIAEDIPEDEEIPVLESTKTDLELRSVETYSEPRVCKGQTGIWQSKGKEVIEGQQ